MHVLGIVLPCNPIRKTHALIPPVNGETALFVISSLRPSGCDAFLFFCPSLVPEENLMSAVLRHAANDAALAADLISDNHVRIYITRDVAFNFDKITKVTQNVLGRLGCDQCHSGRILDFMIM